jgi:hypothetical protein
MEQGEHNSRDVLEQLTQYHPPLHWAPLPPLESLEGWSQHPVRSEEPLAYLHANRTLPAIGQTAAGRGLRGRFLRRLSHRMERVLMPRMQQEQDLLSHLIHMTETLAARCDELTTALAAQQVREAANQARLAGWLDAALRAGQ